MSENVFKILVVGASGVGKTKLLSNFAEYTYKESTQREDIIKNVSYIFREKKNIGILGLDFILNDKKYRFHFWDFKGDEKLEFLSEYYFKGASGALMVFDLSRPETFEISLNYIRVIKKLRCPFGLIGNKADLFEKQELKKSSNYTKSSYKEGAYFYITVSSKVFENSEEYRKNFKNGIKNLLVTIINKNFLETFEKELNMQILIALNLHKELSLAELASYVEKSKATISRKTRFLIKLGLVEAREAEFEKTPGSIKRKYYSLNHDFGVLPEENDIKSFDLKNHKDLAKLREEIWRKTYILSLYEEFGKSLNNIIQKIPTYINPKDEWRLSVADLSKRRKGRKKFIETFLKTSMNLRFINENQYKKLQSLRSEFHLKLNKILEEDDGIKKDHVFIDMVLPILKMKELEDSPFLNDI